MPRPAQLRKESHGSRQPTASSRERPASSRRRQRQQGARRRRSVQPRAEPGPAGHPRLGARVRRAGCPPGGGRVGRARGDTLAVAGIYASGTPDQLVEWVPQCYGTAEEPAVAAFCSSEPDAGSDVSAIRTTARYDEAKDEWILNGQKAWATNGGIAGVHVVIASVDRELGSRGHAAFIVPPRTRGLEQGAKVKKHGLRASHTADVHLDDCRVPGACLLGGKEKLDERLARARDGRKAKSQAAMQTFEASRPTVGSQAVGIARAAYEYALGYAKERSQFGRPIIENQAIAFTLADMKLEIDAARLLVW